MVRPLPPFMGFVNKTIPTAFENSMSYYDTLCVLYNYLHDEILPQINEDIEKIAELTNLYNELKDYVDNYFENLDVQEEINNKLDSMAEDGTLGQLIGAYIDPLIEAQNEHINEEIGRQDQSITDQFTTITGTINDQFIVQNNKINAIENLSPIPVASTSAMTDTTKVYLNTTDDKWYYYDTGTSTWTAGGTYQTSADVSTTTLLNKSIKGFFYVAQNGKVRFSYNSNNGQAIVDVYNSLILKSGNTEVTTTLDQMVTQLGSACVKSADNSHVTITIGNNKFLAYDFDNSTWVLVNSANAMASKYFIACYNGWSLARGQLYDIYLAQTRVDDTDFNNLIKSEKALVYVANDGDIKLSVNSSNGQAFVDIYNSIIIKAGGTEVTTTLANFVSQLGGSAVMSADNTYVRITVGNNQFLVYDFTNATWKIVATASAMHSEYIMGVQNAWANPCSGILYELALKKRVDVLSASNDDVFNSAPYMDIDWKTPATTFCETLEDIDERETFLFFTDPHLMGNGNTFDEAKMKAYVGTVQKVYNSTPTDYIVCGGDWLNNSDSVAQAEFKLGYIDGFCRSMFDNYHPIAGNHDTNYQGVSELSNDTLRNLMFTKEDKCYYKFKGRISTNYVLDTGKDNEYVMTDYRWEQVKWLGDSLKDDNPEHAIIFMHIVYGEQLGTQDFAVYCGQVISAFNSHTTVTVNSVTYDFTSCTGHVDFIMSGHTHQDYETAIIAGIPAIATTWLQDGNTPTFDLVTVDYDNNVVKLTRVGTGSDRSYSI